MVTDSLNPTLVLQKFIFSNFLLMRKEELKLKLENCSST